MPINFTCKCGKALEVDSFLAGRDVRCPACSATVRAPERSTDSSTRLDETPVEHIKARIYEGLERDQLSTKVLVVVGGWFVLFLAISFFTSWSMQFSSFFMWLFIWVPLIALIELAAYLTLTDNHWGRPLLVAGSLIAIGVSWTYVFLAMLSFEGFESTPKSAGITFMSSFVNILVCLGVLWFFGRHYVAEILASTGDSSPLNSPQGSQPQMTDFTSPTPPPARPRRKSKSSRLVPALVVVVLAFAAIVGLLVLDPWHHADSQTVPVPAPTPNPHLSGAPVNTAVKPWHPESPDTVKPPVETPVVPAPSPEIPVASQVRYVGRADYHVYHRLSCKYARRIAPDNIVEFHSAAAARAADYTPCKVCNPPENDAVEVAILPPPVPTPNHPAPTPNPTPVPDPAPVKPVPPVSPQLSGVPGKPVVLELAPIDYHYDVAGRELSTDQGYIRVDYTVDVDRPLKRDQAINLARKLVSGETAKNGVNAISFVIRRKVSGPKDAKWIIWIDWAPNGQITTSNNFQPGDYHTHKFYVVLEGSM